MEAGLSRNATGGTCFDESHLPQASWKARVVVWVAPNGWNLGAVEPRSKTLGPGRVWVQSISVLQGK